MSSNLSNSEILNNLLEGKDLDELTSRSLMQRWLNDEISDVETGAFLSALRAKSSTGVELSSMAEELLNVCKLPVERPNLYMVDTCGTGGDGANTFNISTAVAFVSASCGVKIAKHGNKAITSSSGSADLLHDAGAKIDLNPEQVRKCIEELNFGFMFAPMHHQAMKNVANARKAISPNKTIFNLLGPITNPAGADIQLIGVYNVDSMKLLAQALLKLGTRRAILVNSKDGLDEASIYDLTYVTEIKDNKIAEYTINPDD